MADDLKIRVQVESKAAEAALDRTAAKVSNVKASASGGSGAWNTYANATKAATSALRGFFSAFGVIGVATSAISGIITLLEKWRQYLKSDLVEAHNAAADAAKALREAEEDAARRAAKHYDAAIAKAREYIAALKEIDDYQQGKANAASQVRQANVERENAALDKQVAEGTMSSARKRLNSLNAAQEDRQAQIGLANSRLANARAERNDAFDAREAASQIAEKFAADLATATADINQYVREHENPTGKHEAGGLHFSTFDEAVGYNNLLSKGSRLSIASDEANARRDAAQGKLDELDNNLERTEEEVENALSVLAAQIEAGAAQIEVANAELTKATGEAPATPEIKQDSPKASSSTVTAGSDQWQRIGAFAGGGIQTDALNIQRSSLTALKALQSYTSKIADRMNRAAAATTL